MQTLAEIRGLLAAQGLRPRRSWGQHFLHDPKKLAGVVRAAELSVGEVVLEVGPGTGSLSEELLSCGAYLVGVEIDRRLEPILRERLARWAGRFELIFEDVLAGKHAINPRVLAALERGMVGRGFFVMVANLPYQVASPLLVNLALDEPRMSRAVVMVQREVADRILAGPGEGKDYGPLGIILQAMMEVRVVMDVPAGCFWPQPKVSSRVLRLERRAVALTEDPRGFAELVHRLFAQRRKQLGRILGREASLPPGLKPELRAEQLGLEELVELERWLRQGGAGGDREQKNTWGLERGGL